MQNILSLLPEELEALMAQIGEPKYRARQLFSGLHKGLAPTEISNVGKKTVEKLQGVTTYHLPQVRRKLVSAIDGTIKYLFELEDGNCVESVVMHYKHGSTICISSQVGCRMGCKFCASTIGGRVRDLTPAELVGQVIAAQKDIAASDPSARIGGIVMMGIGEPLDNFDNVIKFLRLVNAEDGICIGYRHISLSTCGVVDKIYELARQDLPITLSISLHACDDTTRSSIMPINNKWGVDALLSACKDYFAATGRRISFEYTLIRGKNDSLAAAEQLANVLNSRLRSRSDTMPIHVNLIPVNPVEETGFDRSDDKAVKAFAAALEKKGVRATVRRKLGADINAACGQLRRAEQKSQT